MFIAVLGHDLRNPLASVDAAARQLLKSPLDARARSLIALMQGSVSRMSNLIANLLDFARGRLGGGFALDRTPDALLKPYLQQVVSELLASNPDRRIDMRLDFSDPVDCDPDRVAQLLSNLIGNALAHGAVDSPIRVEAARVGAAFRLAVANVGNEILSADMQDLFAPFTRGAGAGVVRDGLGLGLYIASEIARAHGGVLTVVSSADETRFTFQMPEG